MVSITSTFSQEEESQPAGQRCQWSCHIESCTPCWREVKICTHIQQYKLRRDEDINKHWNIFVVVRNLMWCTCFIFWETYSSVLKNWYATVLFYQEPYYSVFCLPLSHQSPMSALSGILVSNFLFQNLKSILILN